MNRITFIVAERSYLIRKGIVSIINRIEHASVVKELDSLDEINSSILKYNPHYLVINLELYAEFRMIRNNDVKIDLAFRGVAISSGHGPGKGLKKHFREIIEITDEKEDIFRKITRLVIEKDNDRIISSQLNELSEREKTILKYVAKGFTNKEIADSLFLSTHTVISHRKNITNKLGIKTISGLTVYAILNNIVSVDEIRPLLSGNE